MNDEPNDNIDVFGSNWTRLSEYERQMILQIADHEPSLIAMIQDLKKRKSLNAKLMLDCIHHLTFFEFADD